MLRFLRHQITIWIMMREKQNIRIIVASYVKNVIKQLIRRVIIVQIVIKRKLDNYYYYCADCYYKETDINEKTRMFNERCKVCFQTIVKSKEFGCLYCEIKLFIQGFDKRIDGNKIIIDDIILKKPEVGI